MGTDLRLLVWLRVRHVRMAAVRMVHGVGTDLDGDRSLGDRVYQLYVAGILAVLAVLMWAAGLDAVEEAFAAAGPAFAAGVPSVVLTAFVVAFVYLAVRALRTSPLRLSHPDISFVASTAIGPRALVVTGATAAMLAGIAVGAPGGYLVGAGLDAALGTSGFAAFASLACALCAAAVTGGGWVVGAARLAAGQGRVRRRNLVLVAFGALAFAVGGFAFAAFGTSVLLADAAGWGALAVGALVLVALEGVALVALAPRIDMVAVVQESALAADLDPFGPLSPLDPTEQGDYRRRVKLARRRPLLRLPVAEGRGAVLARAALSLMRQREGLPSLVALGAGVTPLGVGALLGAGGPVMLLFWLMALVLMLPQGPHKATRAFRDDMRVRLVRDRLPFGTLELLVLDTLPAYAAVTILSCAVVAFTLPAGASLAIALGLAVLINAVVLLSCGLEAVRLFPGGPRPWKEVGMIALVAVTSALALFSVPAPWLLAGAAAVGASVAATVRNGVECER